MSYIVRFCPILGSGSDVGLIHCQGLDCLAYFRVDEDTGHCRILDIAIKDDERK